MALFSRSSKRAAGKGGKGATSAKTAPKRPRGARLKTVKAAFVATRKQDPKVLPLVLIAFFGPFLLLLSIGLLVGWGWYLGFLGFLVGLLAATFVFGRRVQATAYSQVEGQVGAAAAVLQNMRGDWRVTPAVGYTREQDLVHRVIGKWADLLATIDREPEAFLGGSDGRITSTRQEAVAALLDAGADPRRVRRALGSGEAGADLRR